MQEIVERVKPFSNFYYLVKVRIKSSLTAQHVERAVRSRLSCTFDSHILECIIYKVVFVNLRVKHGYTYSVAAVNSRKVITCNMVAHELFLHLTVATFGVQHVEPVLCVVRAVLWSPHRKGLRALQEFVIRQHLAGRRVFVEGERGPFKNLLQGIQPGIRRYLSPQRLFGSRGRNIKMVV